MVVTSRMPTSHRLSGTVGSHLCSQGIYEEPSRPPEDGQQNCCVLVNRIDGTHSPLLSKLAIQLWKLCLEKNLCLLAAHLPGVSDCVADEELRTIQSSAEWHLDQKIFCQIVKVDTKGLQCRSVCLRTERPAGVGDQT